LANRCAGVRSKELKNIVTILTKSLSSQQINPWDALCLKVRTSHLETVSTVRGSGWVAVPKYEIAADYEYDRFTHPLPRTVLTVSKCDLDF
jgi:hypothetical protein